MPSISNPQVITLLVGTNNSVVTVENGMEVAEKLKIELYVPAILLLDTSAQALGSGT